MVQPYNGILFSHKKEQSTDTRYNMGEPQKHFTKRKKPDTKGHIMYDSIYIKYPQQLNPQRQKAGSWLPGCGERGMDSDCLMNMGQLWG